MGTDCEWDSLIDLVVKENDGIFLIAFICCSATKCMTQKSRESRLLEFLKNN